MSAGPANFIGLMGSMGLISLMRMARTTSDGGLPMKE